MEETSLPRTITPRIMTASSPDLRAAVSTVAGGVSPGRFGMNLSYQVGDDPANVSRNRELFLGLLGIIPSQLAVPRQVHGSEVRIAEHPGEYDACDGLITNRRGVYLAISVADCLPIFLSSAGTGSVGLVHAGWRGCRLGVVSRAIGMLVAVYGVNPADLTAFIGPGAGACCYEVGEEVALEFGEEFITRTPGQKPHLDLQAHQKAAIMSAGIPEKSIEVLPLCTICRPELFHSYRRDGQRSGRMMAICGLRGGSPSATSGNPPRRTVLPSP